MNKDEIVVLSNDIDINWDLFEGGAKGRKAYKELFLMLEDIGFEIGSEYITSGVKIDFVCKNNPKIVLNIPPRDFKVKTYPSIMKFFNDLNVQGDKFLCWSNITQGKRQILIAKILTWDGVEVDIAISHYWNFCESRKSAYEYIKSNNYIVLSGYKGNQEYMKIGYNCTHNTKADVVPNSFKNGVGCKKCGYETVSKKMKGRLVGELSPCYGRTGKKHPLYGKRGSLCKNWKGGVSSLSQHLRAYMKKSLWTKKSFEVSNYNCVITGKNNGDLQLHHIYGFNIILREALEILRLDTKEEIGEYTIKELNLLESTVEQLHFKYGLGVPLTKNIHDEFHSIYGAGNNTPEQFEEFKKMKLEQAVA